MLVAIILAKQEDEIPVCKLVQTWDHGSSENDPYTQRASGHTTKHTHSVRSRRHALHERVEAVIYRKIQNNMDIG